MTPTLAWPPKEVHEHLDYEADFRPKLQPGELATDHNAVVESGTAEITSIDYVDGEMVVWIRGGVRGQMAKIRCEITTNAARDHTLTITLPII